MGRERRGWKGKKGVMNFVFIDDSGGLGFNSFIAKNYNTSFTFQKSLSGCFFDSSSLHSLPR